MLGENKRDRRGEERKKKKKSERNGGIRKGMENEKTQTGYQSGNWTPVRKK